MRFEHIDKAFFKAWAKRILTLKELFERNYFRWRLTSKGARIHSKAEIGPLKAQGTLSYLTIGEEAFLGRVQITLHDQVYIGKRVCINDGVEILTASHDVSDSQWRQTTKPVIIEDYAWVATGATLLPGVRIGRGAVVGAKAVVRQSVAPGQIVMGNPALPLTKQRPPLLTYNPCEFLAANRSWLLG
ncbi:hypothetical protein [Siphonobacter sp. SORGH_AS_1065]|uniref:acyltransferase n=1 Tax=Siphonobacter sp. SORGH_AS_1065 TaxID=3041795 RepID=UPI00358F1742